MPAYKRFAELSIDAGEWCRNWEYDGKTQEQRKDAVQVGYFSRTDGKITANSRENLHYFKPPLPETNLNGNDYEEFCNQKNRSTGWRYLEPHQRCNIDVLKYDVVAGRSTLVKIATAIYERKYPFEINAVTFRDCKTLFLSSRQTQTVQTEKHHYWGARFEAISTGRETVATESQFMTFFKRKVGPHTLLITAEMDCVLKSKSKKPPSTYVELKCREDVTRNNYSRFMFMYMRYWLQSHLVSVPTIVVGVRDKAGKLVKVDVLRTEKLPEICKQYRDNLEMGWNARKILDFLSFMLTQISRVCEKNAGTTVRLKFDASKQLFTVRLAPEDNFAERAGNALVRLKSRQHRRPDTKHTKPKPQEKPLQSPKDTEKKLYEPKPQKKLQHTPAAVEEEWAKPKPQKKKSQPTPARTKKKRRHQKSWFQRTFGTCFGVL